MARYSGTRQSENIYEVAERFKEQCLLHDNSLLFNETLWTVQNLETLHDAFVGYSSESNESTFFGKLQEQIGSSDKMIIRLAAELLCVYYLFPGQNSISGNTKRRNINQILSWCGDAIPSGNLIISALDCGIGGTGTGYLAHQAFECWWLLEVFIAFKKLPANERQNVNDPWNFSKFIEPIIVKKGRQSRPILLHLLFPDSFERCATQKDKEAIVKAFDHYISNRQESMDEKLLQIRKALEKENSTDQELDFYKSPLKEQWHSPSKPESLEDEFKEWLSTEKKTTGENYTKSTKDQYIVALKKATHELENINVEHTNLFLYHSAAKFEDVFSRIKSAPNYEKVNSKYSSGSYSAGMEKYRKFLSEREKNMDTFEEDTLQDDIIKLTEHELPYSIDDILNEGCFVEKANLESMLERLESKKNIILQGPPGTGKTWLAKRLAYALVGYKNAKQVRSMQFHATLSYEDFICGWRPAGDGKLELLDGPFLELVGEAEKNPHVKYVMVIEEINRGNPAQVFGEMLTLLEADKRHKGEALRLCYQQKGEESRYVHIPENIHLIGTMNIADRSLAVVDFALRRRFSFFDLKPEFGDKWQEWMQNKAGLTVSYSKKIAEKLEACNKVISNDFSLGPQYAIGHSFVTSDRKIIDPKAWFIGVIDTEIAPLLNEYWFDTPSKAENAINPLKKDL